VRGFANAVSRIVPIARGDTPYTSIEDRTNVAKIIVWPSLQEKQRRLILSSGMMAIRGRYQRESGVTHLIAEHLIDLSDLLRSV
jgi:error-prone DNA polymerase